MSGFIALAGAYGLPAMYWGGTEVAGWFSNSVVYGNEVVVPEFGV